MRNNVRPHQAETEAFEINVKWVWQWWGKAVGDVQALPVLIVFWLSPSKIVNWYTGKLLDKFD